MLKKILFLSFFIATSTFAQDRWTASKANAWYAKQPFLVGANYNPANTINQIEMWQAETFDPATIDKELDWAAAIGMNTMRVFLHDLVWSKDPVGYQSRINQFLAICAKHKIKPMLVLFDSCWDPFPELGKQRDPKPGVHNSGWVQGPGAESLTDVSAYPRLEAYVKGVVGAFKNDARILAWDTWNEPDNTNGNSYNALEPKNKVDIVTKMLPDVFKWCRSMKPTQPLTSGVWMIWDNHDWSNPAKWTPMEKIQLELSDVVSFHCYAAPETFEKVINWLKPLNRPILCTEYLARGVNSLFENTLPIARKYKVAAMNWGLVVGKSQTNLPWDSWQKPYVGDHELKIWHHEVFKADGTPYKESEVEAIRKLSPPALNKGVKK